MDNSLLSAQRRVLCTFNQECDKAWDSSANSLLGWVLGAKRGWCTGSQAQKHVFLSAPHGTARSSPRGKSLSVTYQTIDPVALETTSNLWDSWNFRRLQVHLCEPRQTAWCRSTLWRRAEQRRAQDHPVRLAMPSARFVDRNRLLERLLEKLPSQDCEQEMEGFFVS
jgi:hypothetical protein